MKKIEINLYYPFQEESQPNFLVKFIHNHLPLIGLGIVFALTTNLILAGVNIGLGISYKKLNQKWQQLLPQVTAIKNIQKDLQSLQEKEKELENLVNYKVDLAHTLFDISTALPKNIWLNSVYYQEDTFSFNGAVLRWKEDYFASIDRFIKNLKNTAYFSHIFKKIQVKDSCKDTFYGKEIMKFRVVCYP